MIQLLGSVKPRPMDTTSWRISKPTNLKATIIAASLPDEDEAFKRIQAMTLGDQTSKQLLGAMATIYDFRDTDATMCKVFMHKMPPLVQTKLRAFVVGGIRALATEADTAVRSHRFAGTNKAAAVSALA